MRGLKRILLILLLGVLLSGGACKDRSPGMLSPSGQGRRDTLRGNPQAIKDFGINHGEPINKGFLFYEGRYIEAPYVVERRGLEIYINDVLMLEGCEWPRYDLRIDKDPGDPPAGVEKPWERPASGDVRDNYWSRKWRYLEQHFDRKTALQKMKEAYAKSDIFTDVRSGGREGWFILTDLQGKEKGVFYHDPKSLFGGGRPLSREKLLMYYEETKQFYETMLKRDIMLLKLRGGEKYVTGKRADDMIRILLGKGSPEEKIKKLESIHVLTPGADHGFRSIVHNFKATDQLKKRFADRLKRKRHEEPMKRVPDDSVEVSNP